MKKLVLKKLVLISQKNEEARVIEFDDRVTVITGENPEGITINRTGKSLVMKSIYYSLGAKLSKYTSNWSTLQISTIMSFSYDTMDFEIYRNKDKFLLKYNETISFFNSISALREYFVKLFNFRIRMPIKSGDEMLVYAYPGALFMPFYIDQDKGWSGSWDSFSDIFTGKWKSEILLYHMGIRTPKYYDLLDEKVGIENLQSENRRQEKTLKLVLKNHIEKYRSFLDINVDLNDFSKEIVDLTHELSNQMNKRNEIRDELVNCFNEMRELEELYSVAEKVYNELLKDIDYVENDRLEDTIVCPICGTSHENSIQHRFHIYSDMEECDEAMQKYYEDRSMIEKRIQKQTAEFESLESYISKINEILNKKRKTITFREVVVAEGSRSIFNDLKEELDRIENEMIILGKRLKEIRNEQTAITRAGKAISDKYLEKLKINLEGLSVKDIDHKELKKFKPSFNSGGNDLPCAIIAQVFALYYVSAMHSETVTAPIILDAIFQQEPAEEKINTIWDFVLENQPKNSQMVISTTELHSRKIPGKIIQLTEEKGLLNEVDYQIEKVNIDQYKKVLLSCLKENTER